MALRFHPPAPFLPAIGLAAGLALAGCAARPAIDQPRPIAFDAALWRAARETVDFLPLEHTDPAAGVIETGWGEPLGGGAGDGRYRVTVRLDYGAIYANAATVTVAHEVPAGDGWLDVGNDDAAAAGLARAIGAAAGELRLAADGSK